MTPVRTVSLDERPEPPRMVRNAQVAEFVHDHVVEHFARRQHEPPVEREGAACRARAPKRPLAADPDPLVCDSDPLSFLFGKRRNELTRTDARLRLAYREPLETQPWHLAPPLLLDPPPLLC